MALIDLLDAVSAERLIVIQIDDAQWMDRSLGWLWSRVLAWSSTHPVFRLFAFRPQSSERPPLDVPLLALSSLEHAAADTLLDAVLS
ncbi:hypothetical protein, partial [Bradyrhizobium sp. NBAIM08]|uniref:hypothetical protein n=1 Tax=Bradyrhizobium sp. NBAIM08 TaxID=2793815 RepID=UPI001CD2145E